MHSVLYSDLPHSLEFLGSLYGRTNRWKHLFERSPLVYSGADALGTWDVYVGLVNEFKQDPQSAWVYRNCVFPLTPIIMEAESTGLQVHQERLDQALDHHLAQQAVLRAKAQVHTGFPLNLGSSQQVGRWIYQVEKLGEKKQRK